MILAFGILDSHFRPKYTPTVQVWGTLIETQETNTPLFLMESFGFGSIELKGGRIQPVISDG